MTAFVDASVVIAILSQEADWIEQAAAVDGEVELIWSPVSRWESIVGLRRSRDWDFEAARAFVDDFGLEKRFKMISIGDAEARIAVEAAARYGRATGHPAQLNMGDCFAYACAKAHDARLLYKGEDFALTDLA